ncbi:MAG: phosphoenolpyruvate carboxykinase (ATP) [Bacteroidetes bacterium]|nr:phosphoenolpyruvate carboxykinase (ATP) [Bacteroidota bacterium]MBM3424302.1 phosphoenolpyruvate carboxykinase (ATP) [Bacteroidota bacterium]
MESLKTKSEINTTSQQFWNLTPHELTELTLRLQQGRLTHNGTLAINTGKFTGRSPKDRFIVKDHLTQDNVWWGDINIAFSPEAFERLYQKMMHYASNIPLYVRDAYACASLKYRMPLRVVTEYPWSNLFAYNIFLRPNEEELKYFEAEWQVICLPGFLADPLLDETRQANFVVLNFSRKMVLIGGTGYTGEIKKSIFSALNYLLPREKNVLSMHCSANIGQDGDTAIFFGLSGTGKTTLSSDPKRRLIGDDEHGWAHDEIFNFEGGCYAKTIDLSHEKEPQIFDAIKPGALLENIGFKKGSNEPDYYDSSITENTRVSYPIDHIGNIVVPSVGCTPKNIFFLTADAFGVLPPISRLNKDQAMYHFMSGYTAKVAGTEVGISEPTTTFSAGFGAAFLPLHPAKYAELLGEKLEGTDIRVWLINTGWTGGSYGLGSRIKLSYTRAMITAALSGKLDSVPYETIAMFDLAIPTVCEGVPTALLNPRNTWKNKKLYDQTARNLAEKFNKNFEKFEAQTPLNILKAGPQIKL